MSPGTKHPGIYFRCGVQTTFVSKRTMHKPWTNAKVKASRSKYFLTRHRSVKYQLSLGHPTSLAINLVFWVCHKLTTICLLAYFWRVLVLGDIFHNIHGTKTYLWQQSIFLFLKPATQAMFQHFINYTSNFCVNLMLFID